MKITISVCELSFALYLSTLDQVVDLVKENGVSVTFHVMDAASYTQAKAEGFDLSVPHPRPVTNGVGGQTGKPKLCYLVKSTKGYEFSLRSATGEDRKTAAETHNSVHLIKH